MVKRRAGAVLWVYDMPSYITFISRRGMGSEGGGRSEEGEGPPCGAARRYQGAHCRVECGWHYGVVAGLVLPEGMAPGGWLSLAIGTKPAACSVACWDPGLQTGRVVGCRGPDRIVARLKVVRPNNRITSNDSELGTDIDVESRGVELPEPGRRQAPEVL